jgi:hypothetical protein
MYDIKFKTKNDNPIKIPMNVGILKHLLYICPLSIIINILLCISDNIMNARSELKLSPNPI